MVRAAILAGLLATVAPPPVSAVSLASLSERRSHRSLRAWDDGVIVPLKFKQQLLVCNAYPSDSPVLVRKNGHESIASADTALAFQECRYMPTYVQKRDRLEFGLRDREVTGTFEVGALPSADALLLLVLEKQPDSPKVSFQSFAFPSSANAKDAQLAVINTFTGNSSSPYLKMEDHIADKEQQTVAKRVEKLNFNRVYTVEEGGYDVAVTDVHREGVSEQNLNDLEKSTRRNIKLTHNSNYVILRTGGGGYKESLVVFPDNPIPSGSARLQTFGAALAWVLALAFRE